MQITNEDGFRSLNPAIQYNIQVLSVQRGNSFPRNGTEITSFKLMFRDSWGYTYKAEYLSETKEQMFFVPGERATFRVVQDNSSKNYVIAPVDDKQDVEKQLILSMHSRIAAEDVSMRSVTIAAQIFTAERQATMHPIEEKDIERMLAMAETIENYLLNKMAIRANDGTAM